MKAILEFDLNEIDDRNAHLRATKALDMALVLYDIEEYFRSETKYNESLSEDAWNALDKAKTRFYEIMNERGVLIDDILK